MCREDLASRMLSHSFPPNIFEVAQVVAYRFAHSRRSQDKVCGPWDGYYYIPRYLGT